ncbi:MAG TPA: Clp protease N-terminal domain-containing protein [Candidatus Dormibacteraeota bacterium]|nr:Clp protease N-terminal domain-containing protein [Candidatus Dormibacteraeota bacterium]
MSALQASFSPRAHTFTVYPFERFAEDAKRALTLAQEEAESAHHSYIGTEHILLGLLRVEHGTAHQVLKELGIDLESTRRTVREVIGRNERTLIQQIIPTPRVKKVIEIAFEEARRMGSTFVDSGDLLMALSIEGEGIAAHVLQDFGADRQTVVAAVRHVHEAKGGTPRRFRRRAPLGVSPAEELEKLFGVEYIVELLQSRGLDVEALANQLIEPPEAIRELRRRLVVLRAELQTADESDEERLTREESEVAAKLQEAEERWLRSLEP